MAARQQWILFDGDRPLRVSTPMTWMGPSQQTLDHYGATHAKPVKECTREQYEAAQHATIQPDRRTTEGRRRRTAGHGYSGGDEARQAEILEQQNERKAAEEARQVAWAAKVAAVRSSVPLYKVQLTTLPDGSRLHTYTFDTRVQTYTAKNDDGTEKLVTEDAGWLWVVIACKDVEENDWNASNMGELVKVKKVEAAITFRNERSSSFSSCSTERYATEEDAIYECLAYAYHRC